ncbi:MBL fold metallo-hydrolase [Patescibacteria group bacterium AH-259-L05]|nr:MBL fold metallo-hydrolase [Patescibacteria group bacterium AH-259-L05]
MKTKKHNIIIYAVGGLLIVSLVIVGYGTILVDVHQQGNLRVIFLDVGQGDAILVQTPEGKNILIDGGPDKSIIYKLDSYIPITDRTIDIMIATHADLDHITGLAEVLYRYEVKSVLDNGLKGYTPAYYQWQNSISEKNISRVSVDAPQTIVLEDALLLQFLWPDQDKMSDEEADSNFASVVVKLLYDDTSFLLTGDATIETEEILIVNNTDLTADVLKVGHHGSKYSSSIEFINAVKSVYGIISTGEDNTFGHPSLRALKNLEVSGAQILRTDQDGDILFTSDGKTLHVKIQK